MSRFKFYSLPTLILQVAKDGYGYLSDGLMFWEDFTQMNVDGNG
jgi:hypothetical protein